MKDAKQIILSGIGFIIEADAYKILDEYLKEIKKHFEVTMSDISEDIFQDIESSIAEKMISKGRGLQKAITLKDVEEIKEQLGKVSEIGNDNNEEEKITNKKEAEKEAEKENILTKKRILYRDTDDVVIAGVASGLAKYFNIDVVIVRLLFIVTAFLNGIGIWIYIILWATVKKAETSEEKMAMRGEKVNLESIKSYIEDKINDVSESTKNSATNVINSIFLFIKRFFKFLFKNLLPILKNIIGILFIITGAIGVFTSFVLVFAYFYGGFYVEMDLVTAQYFTNDISNMSFWSVIFLSIVIMVPFWFLGMLGNYLISFSKRGRKNKYLIIEIIIFLMLWIVSLMYMSIYIAVNSEKIKTYISTVKKEMQINPNSSFFIRITDKSDRATVLDLELKNNILEIKDDEEKISIPFNNNDLNRNRKINFQIPAK